MKIKQVIIVEGKTDVSKLENIFGPNNIQTIQTNGLGLNEETLRVIKQFNELQGVIVFTDPDGPGVKIRDQINSYLDYKCFNAFIDKKNILNSKKIGIAEADDKNIISALQNLVEFKGDGEQSLSYEEYLQNDFFQKENRESIANYFGWNEKINAKKLFKWLNLMNLTVGDVKKIIGDG